MIAATCVNPELTEKFVAVTEGIAHNTHVTNNAIIKCFLAWWAHGRDYEVRAIHPSSLDEWLASQEPRLRNVSYNRDAGFLKQLFDIAVRDRIIAESPAKSLRVPWKKPQTPKRLCPTVAEFETIIADIRSLPLVSPQKRHTAATADFLGFLGLAGLGQAEASAVTTSRICSVRSTNTPMWHTRNSYRRRVASGSNSASSLGRVRCRCGIGRSGESTTSCVRCRDIDTQHPSASRVHV